MLWNTCIYQNGLFYVQCDISIHRWPSILLRPWRPWSGGNGDQQWWKTLASRWYSENFLQGNPSKYQAMIISNDSTQRDVEIDAFILQPMDELNLLGVLIERNLLFSNHISSACKKAGMWVSILMRMHNMISMKVKLRIYKAAILPYLTYCSLVWHFCRGSDLRKLEKVN